MKQASLLTTQYIVINRTCKHKRRFLCFLLNYESWSGEFVEAGTFRVIVARKIKHKSFRLLYTMSLESLAATPESEVFEPDQIENIKKHPYLIGMVAFWHFSRLRGQVSTTPSYFLNMMHEQNSASEVPVAIFCVGQIVLARTVKMLDIALQRVELDFNSETTIGISLADPDLGDWDEQAEQGANGADDIRLIFAQHCLRRRLDESADLNRHSRFLHVLIVTKLVDCYNAFGEWKEGESLAVHTLLGDVGQVDVTDLQVSLLNSIMAQDTPGRLATAEKLLQGIQREYITFRTDAILAVYQNRVRRELGREISLESTSDLGAAAQTPDPWSTYLIKEFCFELKSTIEHLDKLDELSIADAWTILHSLEERMKEYPKMWKCSEFRQLRKFYYEDSSRLST